MTLKICIRCKSESPATTEFFPPRTNPARSKDGLDYYCRVCIRVIAREVYARNREKVRAREKERRAANADLIRKQKRESAERCKERIRRYSAELYRKNREQRIEAVAQWRRDNPEKAAESRKREYQSAKEAIKQRAREWFQNNRDRVKLNLAARDARERNAPGKFGIADLRKQYQKQDGLCFYCHAQLIDHGSIDHYIPLSKGGTNYPENIVLACWPCNNSKRALDPEVFIKRLKSGA